MIFHRGALGRLCTSGRTIKYPARIVATRTSTWRPGNDAGYGGAPAPGAPVVPTPDVLTMMARIKSRSMGANYTWNSAY